MVGCVASPSGHVCSVISWGLPGPGSQALGERVEVHHQGSCSLQTGWHSRPGPMLEELRDALE